MIMIKPLPKVLSISGWTVSIPCVLYALRLIWEQTLLTWQNGPQMVGFALSHSGLILIFEIGRLAAIIWLVVYFLLAIIKRTTGTYVTYAPALIITISLLLLMAPYSTWKHIFSSQLANSSHAADFMINAASSNDVVLMKMTVKEKLHFTQLHILAVLMRFNF